MGGKECYKRPMEIKKIKLNNFIENLKMKEQIMIEFTLN